MIIFPTLDSYMNCRYKRAVTLYKEIFSDVNCCLDVLEMTIIEGILSRLLDIQQVGREAVPSDVISYVFLVFSVLSRRPSSGVTS